MISYLVIVHEKVTEWVKNKLDRSVFNWSLVLDSKIYRSCYTKALSTKIFVEFCNNPIILTTIS